AGDQRPSLHLRLLFAGFLLAALAPLRFRDRRFLCAERESKRVRRGAEKHSEGAEGIPATSTLMEAQEFGEMMEHVDKVNVALDGLRKGQPLRIRRSSLVSLLTICSTTHQRRLLRTKGVSISLQLSSFLQI
ncbi:hypothetical protein V8G54_010847, partial [Vigna mungo]